ncbi:MAG: BACON domain-containing carbohydrate-binding protein [Bryobacteraceae bacterium]
MLSTITKLICVVVLSLGASSALFGAVACPTTAGTVCVVATGSLTKVSGPDPLLLNGATFTAVADFKASTAAFSSNPSAAYTGVSLTINVSTQASIALPCDAPGAGVTMQTSSSGDVLQVTSCSIFSTSSFVTTINFPGNTLPAPYPMPFPQATVSGGQATYVCGITALCGTDTTPTVLNITTGTITGTCISCQPATPSPTSLTFTGVAGGSPPAAQTFTVTTPSTTLTDAFTVTPSASWLSVTPQGSQTGGSNQISVTANPSTLSAGTYTGSVNIYTAASNAPKTVPVTFNVGSSSFTLTPSPTSFTFNWVTGQATPSGPLSVTSSTGSSSPYTASITSGSPWLTVTPTTGTTGGSAISVVADPTQIATGGTYNGNVHITAGGASNAPDVPVTFNVTKVAPSPTNLSFSYTMLGTVPSAQNLSVTATGANVAYTASSSSSWLKLNTTGGTTNGTPLSVSVDPTGLTNSGSPYSGTISITPTGASTPIQVPVSLTVLPAPTLGVSPSGPLTFVFQTGGSNPPSQALNITSSGAAISYTAAAATNSGGSWLAASPNGTTPGSVNVSVTPGSLAEGSYSGTVTITSAQASNSPVHVTVNLTVSSLPGITASPTSLTFNYTVGGTVPSPQTVTLGSTGTALTVNSSTSNGYLALNQTGTTTPATLSVGLNTAGLAAGTYHGSISVTASGSSNSPLSIPVTVVVAPQPSLTVTPSSLTFTSTIGGSNPAPQNISVGSTTVPLSITAASSAAWLGVSPGSGTTPATLSVSVNPSGLAAGTYQGSITVTSPAASNSPVTLPVTYTVNAKPQAKILITGTVNFTSANTGSPITSPLSIATSDNSKLPFTAATVGSSPWLTVSPGSGTTPGTVTLTINPTGQLPGLHMAQIIVSVPGTADGSKTIAVQLTITGSNLTATPSSLTFTYQPGTSLPPAQTVNIGLASGNTPVPLSAVGTDATWLKVTSASSAPATLQVSISPGALAPGTYGGQVYLTAVGAPAASLVIPVALTVNALPNISATPSSLSFTYQIGGAIPAAQSFAVASDGAQLNFAVSAPGSWLAVNPTRGTTPGTVMVGIDPVGLGAGSYTGTLGVTALGANNKVSVPVTLTVTNPSQFTVAPGALIFTAATGGPAPAPQVVTVAAGTATGFTVSTGGVTWLAVTPSSGTTDATLSVSVNPAGLSDGTFTGTITVTPTGGGGTPATIAVTFRVGTGNTVPTITTAANAGSYASGTVSPGMAIAIFGQGLGPATGVQFLPPDTGSTIATTLSDTEVLFDGNPAPILFTIDGQVNALAPFDSLSGKSTTSLQVSYKGVKSAAVTLQVAPAIPGLFALDGSGKGQGAILNSDSSVNGADNPAAQGSIIVLFGTGGGLTNPASVDGSLNPLNADGKLVLPVTATVGGQAAKVVYSGPAPGLVAGVIQVNVQLPSGIASGNVPVSIQVGAATSPSVTVALK